MNLLQEPHGPVHSSVLFFSLPPEIRLRIYRLLIPARCLVEFIDQVPYWNLTKHSPYSGGSPNSSRPELTKKPGITVGLFRANRVISRETRDVLYGENVFLFKIDGHGQGHSYLKIRSRLDPLCIGDSEGLLRRLRQVELRVCISFAEYLSHCRHRTQLQYFVEAFREHSDGVSALQHLRIKFNPNVPIVRGCRFEGYRTVAELRWQYPLEELVPLRGIEKVTVEGVADWFAICLEKYLTGKGGDLHEIDYPTIEVKRRKANSGERTVTRRTTRTWYMSKYDWEGFAKRNDIVVPEDT